MKVFIIILFILISIILISCIFFLKYHPTFPSKPVRKIDQEQVAEKDETKLYQNEISDLKMRYPDSMVSFSYEIMENGILFHYLGKSEQNRRCCLVFHSSSAFYLAMQSIEEMISKNDTMKNDLYLIYTKTSHQAIAQQCATYFRQHEIRLDWMLSDQTSLYHYFDTKKYYARLGTVRKINVSLEGEDFAKFQPDEFVYESSLFRKAYLSIRSSLPMMLRIQIQNVFTRKNGIRNLWKMDPQIQEDWFTVVSHENNHISIKCETEEEKDSCFDLLRSQEVSFSLISETQSYISNQVDDVEKILRSALVQSYQDIEVVSVLYDDEDDLALEPFCAQHFSFVPVVQIEESRLSGILFYQKLLRK